MIERCAAPHACPREFGDFDGGYFWLGSVGRDFAKELGVKKALVRADYVYNDPDPDSDFTRKKVERKRDVIQRAIHGLTGASLAIALETNEHAKPPEQKTISTDELIETVKRDFGAVELDDESVES